MKDDYIKACNAYLKAFCEMYEFEYSSDSWVASQVGTTAIVSDFFFSMQDIIYCVDWKVPMEELFEWYDYNLSAGILGFSLISLSSWMKGCPRKSEAEIEEIKKRKEEIDRLRKELKIMCNTENNI